MATLTKDQILAADDLPREKVKVPEWGTDGEVYVRTLSGNERDAYEADTLDIKGKNVELNRKMARAKLCARAICDDRGERIFADAEIEALGNKSAKALDRVFAVAQKLNGVSEKDVAELAGK